MIKLSFLCNLSAWIRIYLSKGSMPLFLVLFLLRPCFRCSLYTSCVTTRTQPCRYCSLWAQVALTALKRVYLVKRNLYIYSARNILPYSMWDITNTPHTDTTSSLCPMRLRGQTNKHPLRSQTNPHTEVGDRL